MSQESKNKILVFVAFLAFVGIGVFVAVIFLKDALPEPGVEAIEPAESGQVAGDQPPEADRPKGDDRPSETAMPRPTDEQLREMFEQHGPTQSVNVIVDRETGRSRGFAFVEFETPEAAQAAREALDGKEIEGRPLRVNEAYERGSRGGGGGYGGRRGR